MSKLTKEYVYKGIKFEITVDLNVKVEKKIDGSAFHVVTIKEVGPEARFMNSAENVTDANLMDIVSHCKKHAQMYVDKVEDKVLSRAEQMLLMDRFRYVEEEEIIKEQEVVVKEEIKK